MGPRLAAAWQHRFKQGDWELQQCRLRCAHQLPPNQLKTGENCEGRRVATASCRGDLWGSNKLHWAKAD